MKFNFDSGLWAAVTDAWGDDFASRRGLRLDTGCGSCKATVAVDQLDTHGFILIIRHEDGCEWLRQVEETRQKYPRRHTSR